MSEDIPPEDTVIGIGTDPIDEYRNFFVQAAGPGLTGWGFLMWINTVVGKTLKEAVDICGSDT